MIALHTTPLRVLRGLVARLRLTSPASLVADVIDRQVVAETAAVSACAALAAEIEAKVAAFRAQFAQATADREVTPAEEEQLAASLAAIAGDTQATRTRLTTLSS